MLRCHHPRRTVLYVRGDDQAAMEQAASLPADVVFLDLEDGVAPPAKATARELVCGAAREGRFGVRQEVVIRVNSMTSPWGHDDIAAVGACGACGIVLPKVERVEEVRHAEGVLATLGAPPSLEVWLMMETPRGVLLSEALATASQRVTCLVMGTSDLTRALHARATADRAPLLASFGLCLLTARAQGLTIIDGVHTDRADAGGFAAACAQARDMGFDGKTILYPEQLEEANRVFAPDEEEVAWARRVLASHEAAAGGAASVDGLLLEPFHLHRARHIVGLVEAIAAS